jgi:uncharacterized protein (TIGR02118 family)
MFKRMSVLVRRPDHDRATFSRLWEGHAAPVSALPKVRGYIQNHVEESFGAESPVEADGFVELLWDRPEDMAEAFASDAARPMVEDEPGFLGHGSGYALARAAPLREAGDGKLLLVTRGGSEADRRGLLALSAGMPGLSGVLRDDVINLIAKPGMAPPQPVDVFIHLWFDDLATARDAGRRIAREGGRGRLRLGVYRVRTLRFV